MSSKLILAALLSFLVALPAVAQQRDSSAENESLEQKQNDVSERLRVALLQEKPPVAGDKTDDTHVELLKQIEVVVAQQRSAAATLNDLAQDAAELKSALDSLSTTTFDPPPPYSISFLDDLRAEFDVVQSKRETNEASVQASKQASEAARENFDTSARTLRQLKEKGTDDSPSETIEKAELNARLAEELLAVRRQELSIEQTNQQIIQLQLAIVEKKIAIVTPIAQFTKSTLVEKLAEIDARESSLTREASILQSELRLAEQRWLSARQEVDATATPSGEDVDRVDALKTAQQSIQYELLVTNQHLLRLPLVRNAWERRYRDAIGQATRPQRQEWLEKNEKDQLQLQRERRSRELKLEELRANIAAVDARLESTDEAAPGQRRWLNIKKDALTRQTTVIGDSLFLIDSTARTLEQLRQQIQGDQSRSIADISSDTWNTLKELWNYELTSIDDTSLTVGKIMSSLLLLFFGYFAARWLSSLLANRLPKLGVDEAGAGAIESLSFYALLITFALAALRYANVPLTVFTFLGGAIAIGVGFGSQNILNNFISGLILLAERPIKVGDLILLDGTYGNVKTIGARSTQIRTGENLDIIVPNSKFLENNVVNLTRKDDKLRSSIKVGVAYGSPLEKVIALLDQAATMHKSVNDRPKPMVWFNDFGDSSLTFQLHFWINSRTLTQIKLIETDIRLSIDRLFRENGIVIAFPQQDIHLQSNTPIEFRMIQDDSQSQAS